MPIVNLNQENFREEVLESEKPFLVCFSREGCPACSKIIPILEEVGEVGKVGIVNVYESPKLSSDYKIPAVPTLIIFKNGMSKDKAVGIRPKEVLIEKLSE